MRPVGLLFDEHVTSHLDTALRRQSPASRLFRVGHESAPPTGTGDPELLVWAEENHCTLVTLDHATLPTHFGNHIAAGRRCMGVVVLDPDSSLGQCIGDLLAILGASSAEDWLDRLEYLPL